MVAVTIVVAGDTNCFELSREAQASQLASLMSGFSRMGVVDTLSAFKGESTADTHWFARADEPKIGHQIGVALGKVGVDVPRRYDVVFSSGRAHAAGVHRTPESDHDLVWASLAMHPVSARPAK